MKQPRIQTVLVTLFSSMLLATSLSGCVAGAVVGAGAAVVGGAAKVTGAVVGAGIDAVHTSDEEERAKRERAEREYEREQRRCERRQRQGKAC